MAVEMAPAKRRVTTRAAPRPITAERRSVPGWMQNMDMRGAHGTVQKDYTRA